MKKFGRLDFSRQNTNIPILIFLIFFLNVKFIVKIFAILFVMLYYKNMKWGLSWKNSRLPLFYILIIFLEAFNYLFITRNYSFNYGLVFSMGILQWVFCLLAIHHLKLVIEREENEKVHQTIRLFYFLNFGVSLFFLALLLFHPIWLTYWGQGKDINFSHPSAGDAILGISFDTSTVNATINSLGLIYFLYKRDFLYSSFCLLIIVFCTSNVCFLFITTMLILMIFTVRSKQLRINTILAACVLGFLYFLVSASNRVYMHNYFAQLYILNKNPKLLDGSLDTANDSSITSGSQVDYREYAIDGSKLKKALGHLFALQDHFKSWKSPGDSTAYLFITYEDYETKPGKLISFFQTYNYLKSRLKNLLLGAGVGNFSSKLAFRASGSNVLGTFPSKYWYTSPEFRYNHLATFNYYIRGPASRHSVMNFPFSVYNQIFGEYGLTGAALFAVFYMGYFIKNYRRLSYGRYMILILLGFFTMEYWFEFFSLVVIFELFMLLNIKEGKEPITFQVPPDRVFERNKNQ
jgi:hypothetical protein